jgi:hypothetical protein
LCLRPHLPSLQFLFLLLRQSCSGLQLLRTDPGSDSFCRLSSWRSSTSWGTSTRPCICGVSHCSCSFSAAFFVPWEYLHFLGFGSYSVGLDSIRGRGSSHCRLCSPAAAAFIKFSSSSTSLAPLAKPSIRPVDSFKLSEIKDVKSYLDLHDEIAYYLCSDEYGTRCSDDHLITDPSNAEASCYWESQLRVAVWNGGLRFLFENTGSHFHGKGFEMIDVLNCHCRPDSVTDAFTTLMSLFNDVQGDSKPIVEFRSHFDEMIMDMLRCKVVIPPLLLVMIFIYALHSRYSDILNQFRS